MSLRPTLLAFFKISLPSSTNRIPLCTLHCPAPHFARPHPSIRQHPIRKGSTLPHQHRIQKSAVNWALIAICAAVGTTFGLAVGVYKGYTSAGNQTQDPEFALQPPHHDMAIQMPKGRPGTLTAEEEAKLRELWHLALQLSGVAEASLASPNGKSSQSPALSRTTSESSNGEKKKKKRLSLFKKKKKDDHIEDVPETARSTPSAPSSTAESVKTIADGMKDDKHGTASSFKAALAESTPAEIHEAFWNMVKHDHPDALLLRFLRARKWDVNAAFVMAISALHWRLAESNVDSDIMPNGEQGMIDWSQSTSIPAEKAKEGADFMSQIRMGKSFLHGSDKEGRPICYVRVRLHKPGAECEESLERFTVYTIETARMLLRPPVDTATVVFDMTDFGMANMDYAPVKFMIKCFEANYPESLGVVLVHKAPWVFNAVWRIIKGWLDPVVASKIHFTNSLADLQNFIDKSSIIKELGGPVDWSYEYIEPREGENAKMKDTATRQRLEQERAELSKAYESAILEWIAASPPRPSTSAGGKPALTPASEADALMQKRDEIATKLKKNYWQLDPYVRARSIYDRTGELRAEGAPADVEVLSKQLTNATLSVPQGENSGRPSVDSAAQSFYTTREDWEEDVD